jgi:mono/diheme cytochrome c family protein
MATVISGIPIDPALRTRIRAALAEAVERMHPPAGTLQVTFFDDDGPKHGPAIRCAVTVRRRRRAPIHVEHVADNARAAFDAVHDALVRRVRESAERERDLRRRPKKYFAAKRVMTGGLALLVLLATAAVAPAQAPAPGAPSAPPSAGRPAVPFAPEWAQIAGFDVFAKKDCGKCHSVRGVGGKVGPDLARTAGGTSFFAIGASLWNHVPKMGARMREAGLDRATLTSRETADLIAFLFTAQYGDESGDAASGAKLFASKGCAACHAIAGSGGTVGPELDKVKRARSPVLVAAALWNHGPQMAQAFADKNVSRPQIEGKELLDIVAYVQSVSKDAGETEQIIPGTPERGRKLFSDKRCVACHAVGGRGGRIGPDLGTARHHVSLTEFATRMWNHQEPMAQRMKEQRIEPPKLTGQDMADILAYLYVSRYFDPEGNAARGAALVKEKGCLGCHTARGAGGQGAGDFARSTVVQTAPGLVAGMWNHSRLMERAARERSVAWPTLTGEELSDLSAYFRSLSAASRAKPAK